MSDLHFSCPSCNQVLEAPADMAGDTVDCPACGQPMVIPEPPREEHSPDDGSVGGEAAGMPRRDDLSLDDISIEGASPASADRPAAEKKGAPLVSAADVAAQAAAEEPETAGSQAARCSECGAEMEPDSVLCLSCGYHKTLGKKISTEIE